jgi:hypothetical protein
VLASARLELNRGQNEFGGEGWCGSLGGGFGFEARAWGSGDVGRVCGHAAVLHRASACDKSSCHVASDLPINFVDPYGNGGCDRECQCLKQIK